MKALNINQTKVIQSKFEDNKDLPTKWHIRGIDHITYTAIEDMCTEYEVDPEAFSNAKARSVMHFNRKKLDLVRTGLIDVEDFIDPQTEKVVKFQSIATNRFGKSKNIVSDEFLKLIPSPVLDELAEEIMKMTVISEEERKN